MVARERTTGEVVGFSRFSQMFVGPDDMEIGWTFLTRDHWGGPSNAELKRLMLDHAFAHVDTVLFQIGADNIRSRWIPTPVSGKPASAATARSVSAISN